MKLDIFMQKTSNLYAENRLMKFFIVIIGTAVVINTYVSYRALNSQRTILVPPVLNSKVEISGDKASDDYIKSFTRYICGLALGYNSAAARSQFVELLTIYAPESFPAAQKAFYDLADAIELSKVSNSYVIQRITVDSSKHQIEVQGTNMQFAQDKKVEESTKTYLIDYRIRNGKFEVLSFREKELK